MPIIKSAKKKLRQDKKRTKQNQLVKRSVKETVLAFKRKPTPVSLSKLFSELDTSVKKKIFHPNKAARLKSRLSKLLSPKSRSVENKPQKVIKSKSPRNKKTGV